MSPVSFRVPIARTFVRPVALLAGLLLPAVGHAGSPSGPAADARQLACLALNIYHEGRGEPARGRAAIAAVTMNRVRSSRFPDTVCEVVWQYKQFSWTRLADRHLVVRDHRAWRDALVIAELFLGGARFAEIGNAAHYHSVDVLPRWSEADRLVALIGRHLFYTL